MDMQTKKTGEETDDGKRPLYMNVIYGILILIGVLAVIVLVAKFAFNVDLVNFDQLLGARITKSDLIKLQ
jgi:hypothetical protein